MKSARTYEGFSEIRGWLLQWWFLPTRWHLFVQRDNDPKIRVAIGPFQLRVYGPIRRKGSHV